MIEDTSYRYRYLLRLIESIERASICRRPGLEVGIVDEKTVSLEAKIAGPMPIAA